MALLGNGCREFVNGRLFGATAISGHVPALLESQWHQAAPMRNMFAGAGITDSKASVPSGVRHPVAWVMARKNGGMSSRNNASFTLGGTGAGALGVPIDGTGGFNITFADAAGQLISSGTGSASMTFAATGNVLATLSTTGSASMTFGTNTPLLGALGWVTATGAFSVNGTMTSYGKGFMVGSTADTGSVINANIVSVNGYAVTGNGQTGSEWGPQ
jgi:hypothetical protein